MLQIISSCFMGGLVRRARKVQVSDSGTRGEEGWGWGAKQKPAGWQVDGAGRRPGADLRHPPSEEHWRRNSLPQLSGKDV